MAKHAVYVYKQAPVPGQSLIRREALSGFDKKILSILQSEINRLHLNWDISIDDTEGDFSQLKDRNYSLILCTPFVYRWLLGSKTNLCGVIFLTVTEYYLSTTKFYKSSVKRILDFMIKNQDQE